MNRMVLPRMSGIEMLGILIVLVGHLGTLSSGEAENVGICVTKSMGRVPSIERW